MLFRRNRAGRGTPPDVANLADDAALLLEGRVLDAAYESGGKVPAWAWVNKLAHGSVEQLEQFSHDPGSPSKRPELWVWRRTTAFLAGELLHCATHSGVQLIELQRSLLVPIELGALNNPIGPSTLLRVVLGALSSHGVRQG